MRGGFLDCFELLNALLEGFSDYSLKELRCKQQGDSCRFGVADTDLYLFNLDWNLPLFC